jgi:hypothetical protein
VRAALDAALEQLPAGMAQAAPAPEAQKDPNEPDTDRSQPRSFDSPDATRRAS